VFLVKDLSYNLLSVCNLDRKGFIINTDNGKAKIIKNSTVVGIANRDGTLYKLSMTVKEVDECEAYSAVNMKNSKTWHSRLGHVGNDQFQQSAKTADRVNVKTHSDVPEVCETCGSSKQTRVPHKQMKVNVLRPLERIHSNGSNEGTQNNQVQEGDNNVNMEDNKTKRKKKQKKRSHIAQMHKKRKLKHREKL
jgi:hypothetical protein